MTETNELQPTPENEVQAAEVQTAPAPEATATQAEEIINVPEEEPETLRSLQLRNLPLRSLQLGHLPLRSPQLRNPLQRALHVPFMRLRNKWWIAFAKSRRRTRVVTRMSWTCSSKSSTSYTKPHRWQLAMPSLRKAELLRTGVPRSMPPRRTSRQLWPISAYQGTGNHP